MPVQAVTSTEPKGLTVSPLRSELQITPGTSLDGTLMVTNSTDKSMTVSFDAQEFNVINQQYDYAFTIDSDITKWVRFSSSTVNLTANQTKNIHYNVSVPLSAEPSGQYISLFVSTDILASDGSVSSRQRIASLLYITVLGDVSRTGHLISLVSPWAVSGKSVWSMALQNTGTTHFHSRYNVDITNLWGGVVASNSGDVLILPGTVRLVPDILPLPQFPGIYKVIYMIGLGDTPATTKIRYILYVPPAVILIFIVVGMAIIRLVYRRLSKR
ncbi:MAG: hypothetical protein WA087_01180 [Candidatus Saccharimonadales bacterium]